MRQLSGRTEGLCRARNGYCTVLQYRAPHFTRLSKRSHLVVLLYEHGPSAVLALIESGLSPLAQLGPLHAQILLFAWSCPYACLARHTYTPKTLIVPWTSSHAYAR